jgi:hypothetical protein
MTIKEANNTLTKKYFLILVFMCFIYSMCYSQDIEKCEKIVSLTVEAMNTDSIDKLQPELADNFSFIGYTGNTAKTFLLQVVPQLTPQFGKIKGIEKLNEKLKDGELTILYSFDYDNIGNDNIEFIFDSDNKLKSLTFEGVQGNTKNVDETKFDKALIAKLDSIDREDQQYRLQLNDIKQNSDEMKALWKTINEKDSTNLIEIKKILDERGWLGQDIIGEQGNTTLFLVIQHADLKTQETYLPMMREAVSQGNAKAYDLALLEDRINMRQGKKQIYGSQTIIDSKTGKQYVFPLEDPDNVDKRRAEVGLGTMSQYLLSSFGINWNVEEYKEKLPELEAKHGIK